MNDPFETFGPVINPASGLPLIEDTYIDVNGNPYGTDLHTWQPASYEPFDCDYPAGPWVDSW
jgi:hypothetical protein